MHRRARLALRSRGTQAHRAKSSRRSAALRCKATAYIPLASLLTSHLRTARAAPQWLPSAARVALEKTGPPRAAPSPASGDCCSKPGRCACWCSSWAIREAPQRPCPMPESPPSARQLRRQVSPLRRALENGPASLGSRAGLGVPVARSRRHDAEAARARASAGEQRAQRPPPPPLPSPRRATPRASGRLRRFPAQRMRRAAAVVGRARRAARQLKGVFTPQRPQ